MDSEGGGEAFALPPSEYKPIAQSENARVVKTLSRAENKLLPDILPNGDKTAAAATHDALVGKSVNIYRPSAKRVEDDRIKATINANPMNKVERLGINSSPLPLVVRARRAAAARAGKMLDFCNRPKLGPNSERRTNQSDISISDDPQPRSAGRLRLKSNKRTLPNAGQQKRNTNKGKLSRSQLRGRAQRSLERGEKLLIKTTTPKKLAKSKNIMITPERIAEWFEDIPESDRLCSLPTSAPSPNVKSNSNTQKERRASMAARIQIDENAFQKRYAEKEKLKRKMRRRKKMKKNSKKAPSISKSMPVQYFGINPTLKRANTSNNPLSAGKNFDAKSKIVVGFDTLRRGPNPKRVPPRLKSFWQNQEKTGIGHKILSDGFTLSTFEVNPKEAYSDLPVSKEMQETIKKRILGGTNEVRDGTDHLGKGGVLRRTKSMTNIWDDFWTDEVGSELAAPLTSAIFVSDSDTVLHDGETAAQDAPAFVVDDKTATARLPHAGRRFQYAAHAHAAASRMQRIYHHRRSVRNFASTRISSCFRGYVVRRAYVEKRRRRQAAAILIASAFRGRKARAHASFIRETGWNNVAILCQRGIRRYLARREMERRRDLQIFNAATCIQRHVRGIKGRVEAVRWRLYVRDRSARSIQNMVRYVHFKEALEEYRFVMITATEDIQRVFRGHLGRRAVKLMRQKIRAALDIQRAWRGFLGRRRFRRKMDVVRTAATIIQVRMRGIIARRIAADTRETILKAEANRTDREESACARALSTTRDFLLTKGGKNELKQHRKDIMAEKRKQVLSSTDETLANNRRNLMSLKKAFQLVVFRCTGLIDRHQFEELLCGTLLIAMSESQLNSAWSKTATVKARRGGYRLCDPADQRELCEIVPWFISGEDRKTGWKASVGHASLKLGRALSCKAGKTKRRAENRVFLRTRLECIASFRNDFPPPFACTECTKRFVFSYELEIHMRGRGGEATSCQGKYFVPGLDD